MGMVIILVMAGAAFAQTSQPVCGPAAEGQVSPGGCTCGHRAASLLSTRPAGWQWTCDLLRQGSGPDLPADLPGRAEGLPQGLVYAPQSQPAARQGY